jgi:hypothetical protein
MNRNLKEWLNEDTRMSGKQIALLVFLGLVVVGWSAKKICDFSPSCTAERVAEARIEAERAEAERLAKKYPDYERSEQRMRNLYGDDVVDEIKSAQERARARHCQDWTC